MIEDLQEYKSGKRANRVMVSAAPARMPRPTLPRIDVLFPAHDKHFLLLCQLPDDLGPKIGEEIAKRHYGNQFTSGAAPATLTLFRTKVALTSRFCHFLVEPAALGAANGNRRAFAREPGGAMQKGKPMGLSFAHILILVLVLVLLFGRGKISEVMGDLAKGLKSFKQNMQDEQPPAAQTKTLELESDRRPVPNPSKEEHKVG